METTVRRVAKIHLLHEGGLNRFQNTSTMNAAYLIRGVDELRNFLEEEIDYSCEILSLISQGDSARAAEQEMLQERR